MGYRLLTQGILIVASLVIIFAFIQPELSVIKEKQDELLKYSETLDKAAQFNARLRELIQRRDSFSQENMAALEKFMPTEIDPLRIMSEIAGIFSTRNITIVSLTANVPVAPIDDIAFEDSVLARSASQMNLAYQDYEVVFIATYPQMREVLRYAEASNSLFEVVELTFDTASEAQVDREGDATPSVATQNDNYTFKIIFRTFGLPVNTSS